MRRKMYAIAYAGKFDIIWGQEPIAIPIVFNS